MKKTIRVFSIILLLAILLCGCTKENVPKIIQGVPPSTTLSYTTSAHSVTQVGTRLYFNSGSEKTLYYAQFKNERWKIEETQFHHVSYITSYESLIYFLDDDYNLTLFNIATDKVITQISLRDQVEGTSERTFFLVCADQGGVYLQGSYQTRMIEGKKMREDYTVFIKVDNGGEISVLKKIEEPNLARLALVDENTLFYDWTDQEGNFGVLSWDMDTEELITVSSRRGEGLSSYGVKYYIWNDSLVFPDEYEGFCIAKLDGSGEYIEEFVTGKSYTMIGDSIYAANGKIEELNLKTGQVRHFDDIEGYYSGTLTIYDEKFILLRYEAAYIGGTPADDKTIYSFPIADYQ